jgi:hypothetical protein
MRLSLFIPELVWPEPDDGVLADIDCPSLSTLLARGTFSKASKTSAETSLAALFGQPPTVSLAALRRAGEADTRALPDAAGLVCADPVHLRFHEEHLILADSDHFEITREDAGFLVASLNAALGDEAFFEAASAGRWYLRLCDTSLAKEIETAPLSQVAGRSIARVLPEAFSGKRLRQFFNEAQMLLHAHPLNQARENSGSETVNGLWLWGAGETPERVDSDFDGVWSNNALARGLARCAGVPAHPEPIDAAALFAHAAQGSEQLVVIDALLAPAHYENEIACRDALQALEKRWFAPLKAALAGGGVASLQLVAPTAYGVLAWQIKRSDRWKFWRAPQSLVEVAKSLAAAKSPFA